MRWKNKIPKEEEARKKNDLQRITSIDFNFWATRSIDKNQNDCKNWWKWCKNCVQNRANTSILSVQEKNSVANQVKLLLLILHFMKWPTST